MKFIRHINPISSDSILSVHHTSEMIIKYLNNMNSIQIENFANFKNFDRKIKNDTISKFYDVLIKHYLYPKLSTNEFEGIIHVQDQSYAHIKKFFKKKSLITVCDIIPILAYEGKLKNIKLKRKPHLFYYSMSFVKNYDYIIVNSKRVQESLYKFGIINKKNDCQLVKLGVDDIFFEQKNKNKYELKKKFNLPIDKFIILITGRSYYKNHKIILQSIDNLNDNDDYCVVRLGGKSTFYKEDYSKFSKENLILDFYNLTNLEVAELFRAVDLMVNTSIEEGYGKTPFECFACGTPVLLSDIDTFNENFSNNLIKIDPYNIKDHEKYISLFRKSEVFYREITNQGFEEVSHFKWKKVLEPLAEVYKEI